MRVRQAGKTNNPSMPSVETLGRFGRGASATCRGCGRSVLVALASMMLLAACAGSDGGDDTASTDATEVLGDAAPSADAATAEPVDSGQAKTLDEYLGTAASLVRNGGNGRPFAGADADVLLEEQRLIQIEIQKCMQVQGFTYTPEEVGDGLGVFLRAESEGVAPGDYAATEGFGISTRFDAVLEGDFDLTEETDPNEEHLATLSEGEADAWQFALQGAPPERNEAGQLIDPETGEVLQGGGRGAAGGCRLEAQTAVRGEVAMLDDLSDDFAELNERIESDPRVAEIRRSWTDCMREAGFDYADEDEARADFQSQLRPLLRSFFASGDAGEAQDDGNGDGGQGAGQGPGRGGNLLQTVAGLQLTPEQELELESLQDVERSVAIASVECNGDGPAEIEEITAVYEAEWVDANRDALEAFGA